MEPQLFEARDDGDAFLVDVAGEPGMIVPGVLRGPADRGEASAVALDARGEEVSVVIRGGIAPRPLERLFAYGTLRRGGSYHSLLTSGGRAAHLCDATLSGTLLDLGAYPGFVHGDGVVHGELWSHPSTLLGALDALEDFRGYLRAGSLYRRIIVNTSAGLAWTYLLLTPSRALGVVPSGDWMRPRGP